MNGLSCRIDAKLHKWPLVLGLTCPSTTSHDIRPVAAFRRQSRPTAWITRPVLAPEFPAAGSALPLALPIDIWSHPTHAPTRCDLALWHLLLRCCSCLRSRCCLRCCLRSRGCLFCCKPLPLPQAFFRHFHSELLTRQASCSRRDQICKPTPQPPQPPQRSQPSGEHGLSSCLRQWRWAQTWAKLALAMDTCTYYTSNTLTAKDPKQQISWLRISCIQTSVCYIHTHTQQPKWLGLISPHPLPPVSSVAIVDHVNVCTRHVVHIRLLQFPDISSPHLLSLPLELPAMWIFCIHCNSLFEGEEVCLFCGNRYPVVMMALPDICNDWDVNFFN